jgi:SAM-dependent methyltransferase
VGGTLMALARWAKEPAFYRDRGIVQGSVLDIGPGDDPLCRYAAMFPQAERWTCLDHVVQQEQYGADWVLGDATTGALEMQPRQFHTVYSSHSLEHVVDPQKALRAWWALVRPGGHLVVIVPSWVHYEREVWGPRFNRDHKTAWNLLLTGTNPSFMRGIVNEVAQLTGCILLRATTLDENWEPGERDQTWTHECECAFEVILQKPEES